MTQPPTPAPKTASELAARLSAERMGLPFLLLRDGDETQRVIPLSPDGERVTIGRDASNALALTWDGEVSRVHAELEHVGHEWILSDQGMSRNGSYVNGQAISGRRRLDDGDVMRFGQTPVLYTMPGAAGPQTTLQAAAAPVIDDLTAMQRRILSALCRPLVVEGPGAMPASNQEIADTVHLSVQGVKSQLRTLTERFEVSELPQNRKRLALAERAVRAGFGSRVEA
jgi:DNA-binding CsgD family transcriptional regulator